MDLDTAFSAKAGEDEIFHATVKIDHPSVLRAFKYHLGNAAFDLGILIGVNDIDGGLELGFSDPKHYQAAMARVDLKMPKSAYIIQARENALEGAIERSLHR